MNTAGNVPPWRFLLIDVKCGWGRVQSSCTRPISKKPLEKYGMLNGRGCFYNPLNFDQSGAQPPYFKEINKSEYCSRIRGWKFTSNWGRILIPKLPRKGMSIINSRQLIIDNCLVSSRASHFTPVPNTLSTKGGYGTKRHDRYAHGRRLPTLPPNLKLHSIPPPPKGIVPPTHSPPPLRFRRISTSVSFRVRS